MLDPTQIEAIWRTEPSADRLVSNLSVVAEYDRDLARRIDDAPQIDVDIARTEDGGVTAVWHGRRLASARGARDEAIRIVDTVDPERCAVPLVVGFGIGLHVAMLSNRLRDTGIVLVFESDLSLLRAMLTRIDPSIWSVGSPIRVTDRTDVPHLAKMTAGIESLLMIGTEIVEHPPSRARLNDAGPMCSRALRELAANTRMTINTTLLRSRTTLENQLGNIGIYAEGSGIDDLRGLARGRLGVVVSAGPSLQRNIDHLARPGIRERCLIAATQTTLRPLIDRGIRPHYVVAIDYHEISRRFYEGIDSRMLEDTELVIDTKVNPLVPESFPGRIRAIPSPVLDRVLGRPTGEESIPPSSTVAHLAYGFLRYLGCDPVALIGQDLGFTDGLYYAPGNAIHDVWAPEFNDFNTIETMEWERIARHRPMLSRQEDVNGRPIFTDAQMLTYLQRFEVQFEIDVAAGLRVIDATEGGLQKRFVEHKTLAEAIVDHPAPDEPLALPVARSIGGGDGEAIVDRLRAVAEDAATLAECSVEAVGIVEEMIEHQRDERRMASCFERLDRVRERVTGLADVSTLSDSINQAGAFRRLQADRRIRLLEGRDEFDLQRRELDRDLVNITETRRSATTLKRLLDDAGQRIEDGTAWRSRGNQDPARLPGVDAPSTRVIAVMPVDPERGGTGVSRRLETTFGGVPVMQRTLERLGTSEELSEIVLLVPRGFDVAPLIDRRRIGLPIRIERNDGPVFPPGHEAVRLARSMHPTSWRGGLNGLTIYDEVFAPKAARAAIAGRSVTGVVFVGPDWPLVTIHGDAGIDALVRRHRLDPSPVRFVHAPPGIGAALIPAKVLDSVSDREDRGVSIGAWLGYSPDNPKGDPIAGPYCLVPDAVVRNALGRYTFDSPRQIARMRHCFEEDARSGDRSLVPTRVVERMENRIMGLPLMGPQFVRVELCTGRRGVHVGTPFAGEIQRVPMSTSTFRRIVDALGDAGDTILTLSGLGDPMLHPRFDDFVMMAVDAGIRAVRIRTDLSVDADLIDRLLAAPIAAVEVDLGAESRGVYERVHGVDMFDHVRSNLERILASRRTLGGTGMERDRRFGVPWVVPRIERREETIGEIPEFFERWRRRLGVAVIDGAPIWPNHFEIDHDGLIPTHSPDRYRRLVAATRMTILSDGSVPSDERDLTGVDTVGRVQDQPLRRLWRIVTARRHDEVERRNQHASSAL